MPRDGHEIGSAETPGRRRASASSTPRCPSPSAPIDASQPAKRRSKRANRSSTPRAGSPACSPIGPAQAGAGGDGHSALGTHISFAIPGLIAELAVKQTMRKQCISAVSKQKRSCDSMLVALLHGDSALAEAPKKTLFDHAAKLRRAIEKTGTIEWPGHAPTEAALQAAIPLVQLSVTNAESSAVLRAKIEGEMEKVARTLHVWPWVESVRGFGAKGLAIIVAESRIPIGEWRSVAGFWKHMALSVENGRAQRLPEKVAPGDAGKVFNKRRRAEMFALGAALLKGQWLGDRDEDGAKPATTGKPVAVPAHALGPYGEIYAAAKAKALPRVEATADLPAKIGGYANPAKWTPKRCDVHAQRVMFKALLRDLWRVWRGLPPRGAAPAEGA